VARTTCCPGSRGTLPREQEVAGKRTIAKVWRKSFGDLLWLS
jgi:hypothetical protein